MSRRKGTVTKAGKGQYSWFLQLDGDDFYYNTKFEPKCGEGDVVGVEFDKKADNRGNIKKITILEDNSGGYAKANSERSESSGGSGGKSGGGKGYADRSPSIVMQHSQEMAISTVSLIVSTEAVKLPAKADAKRVIIDELVGEYTAFYYAQAIDPKFDKDDEKSDKSDDDWDDDAKGDDDPDDEWDD